MPCRAFRMQASDAAFVQLCQMKATCIAVAVEVLFVGLSADHLLLQLLLCLAGIHSKQAGLDLSCSRLLLEVLPAATLQGWIICHVKQFTGFRAPILLATSHVSC